MFLFANLTVTLAPVSNANVPAVTETVLTCVPAVSEQVPYLVTVAPVIPSCLIVWCVFGLVGNFAEISLPFIVAITTDESQDNASVLSTTVTGVSASSRQSGSPFAFVFQTLLAWPEPAAT